MIYLFIHQNFPGQYRHLIRQLADKRGNTVYFITQPNANEMQGVHKISYSVAHQRAPNCHALTIDIDRAIRTGSAVAEVCRMLESQGVRPDIIVGHCGWGETLFVKDVFPDVPLMTYFEYYYTQNGADLNFDPEFSQVFGNASRLRTRNAVNLMAFESCDWTHTPTQWQYSLHPPDMRKHMTVIHEGIDTDTVRPNAKAALTLPNGLTLTRRDQVITYVARNLEPYRGFHVFMRALPEIQRRNPDAHIVMVGGDGVSYGAPAAPRSTYRQIMLEEVGNKLDRSRVHFLGQLSYADYVKTLQISAAHVYLTYPFILSWSCLEAMAAGCLLIGSRTAPVQEVIRDGVNGLLVDFFDPEELVDKVSRALRHKDRMQKARDAARKTVIEKYDLRRVALPQWQALLQDVASSRKPRSTYIAGRSRT